VILYVTKKTKERFDFPLLEELQLDRQATAMHILEKEKDIPVFMWALKIFYFDRRKCLQVMNFSSNFCIFLIDVRVKDIPNIGNMIGTYLGIMYQDDKEMLRLLDCYFNESPVAFFDVLKDRSMISYLNNNELTFLDNGYRLYDFLSDGIMHSIELNKKYNFDYLVSKKINGQQEYFQTSEKFKEILQDRYRKVEKNMIFKKYK